MKKIFTAISVIVIFAVIAPTFAQTTSTSAQIQSLLNQLQQLQAQIQQLQAQRQAVVVSLISTLQQGASGDQVKVLQAVLAADPNVYPEGLITGFYGVLTRKAVMKFQQKHGLPQVGVVGPMTREKLNKELERNPVGLESQNTTSSTASSTGGRPCAIVPPGHLIAPGWLRKQGGVLPVVPQCQTLPPGILSKLQNTSTSTPPVSTSTPDIVAPVISGVASAVASTTATVNWTTNESSTSQVFYGTSTAMGLNTALDMNLVMSHSQALSGLVASTTYYYVAQSKDAAGNLASSTQQTFITLGQ